MNKPILVLAILALTSISYAQQSSRLFDNFDTSRGVQVARQAFVPIASRTGNAVPAAKLSKGKKLLQKTALVEPRAPRQSRISMNVSEGLADRESGRAISRFTMSASREMHGFTTGDSVVDSYIVESSRRYGVDPLLIYSQMHQESSFKPRATSNKGASGLMQLMPGTARRMGVDNIYDPKQNIEGGVKYMRLLLDMFGGDISLALAGYNAGEGAVMKFGNQIPPYSETREYVRRITARYNEISDPSIARNVKKVSGTQAARLGQQDARPLSVYEPNAVAIKLADGRMRLVNQ